MLRNLNIGLLMFFVVEKRKPGNGPVFTKSMRFSTYSVNASECRQEFPTAHKDSTIAIQVCRAVVVNRFEHTRLIVVVSGL